MLLGTLYGGTRRSTARIIWGRLCMVVHGEARQEELGLVVRSAVCHTFIDNIIVSFRLEGYRSTIISWLPWLRSTHKELRSHQTVDTRTEVSARRAASEDEKLVPCSGMQRRVFFQNKYSFVDIRRQHFHFERRGQATRHVLQVRTLTAHTTKKTKSRKGRLAFKLAL